VGGLSGLPLWRTELEIDVSDHLGSSGPIVMRGWAVGPAAVPERPLVVFCYAGGGCSTDYFDLEVEGLDGYSMADAFARRGAVVVAVDHPGIGASDEVADLFALTPSLVAACNAHVVQTVVRALSVGGLRPLPSLTSPFVVGFGHSMGGLLVTAQQAHHGSFDALIYAGHSGLGLPEVLTDDELAVSGPDLMSTEEQICSLARLRFAPNSSVPRKQPAHGTFFADDVPAAVRQAFTDRAVPLLSTCGLTSMIPGSARAERASIDVPTFFAFGDHDLITDYTGSLAQYRSVTDAALYVLAGSGHCQNQASGRHILWTRMLDWLASVRGAESLGRPGVPPKHASRQFGPDHPNGV
jgi:pimeloyl-ACP methyl ester carboxylesterase